MCDTLGRPDGALGHGLLRPQRRAHGAQLDAARLPLARLGALAIKRLTLGTSESLATTGATMWGIGRAGPDHTARVISWNGVATYVGAGGGRSLGVLLASRLGFGAVGALICLMGAAGFAGSGRMAPTEPPRGEPVPITRLLWGVSRFRHGPGLGEPGLRRHRTFITSTSPSATGRGGPVAHPVRPVLVAHGFPATVHRALRWLPGGHGVLRGGSRGPRLLA